MLVASYEIIKRLLVLGYDVTRTGLHFAWAGSRTAAERNGVHEYRRF
jgi:hypothetical protein